MKVRTLLLAGGGIAICLVASGCGIGGGTSAAVAAGGTGSASANEPAPSTKVASNDVPPKTPGLPDGSFEGTPSEWMMGPTSTIVDTVAHSGKRALRVELDRGLGSMGVTRSAYFSDIEVGPDYVVSFHYRYEHCKSALFTLQIGDYEKKLQLEGTEGNWTKGSIVVSFAKKPAWVDVTAGRMGAADQYQGAEFDDNVLWLDDIEVVRK